MSSSQTELLVFKIRRHWRGMQPPADRRTSKRFGKAEVSAQVALIDTAAEGLTLSGCSLLNLSYGGMGLNSEFPLKPGAAYPFLLNLGAPFSDVVLVKARVVWMEPGRGGGCLAGTEFVESSKGWLGPDEEDEDQDG